MSKKQSPLIFILAGLFLLIVAGFGFYFQHMAALYPNDQADSMVIALFKAVIACTTLLIVKCLFRLAK